MLPPQWIVGGGCRETKQCSLKAVPGLSATTLLAVIRETIIEGSTIFSDCWKGCKTPELEAAGFQHLTANHRYHLVDSLIGAHTQNIKRIWDFLKWRNRQRRGTLRHLTDSCLGEFILRQDSLQFIVNTENPTFFTDWRQRPIRCSRSGYQKLCERRGKVLQCKLIWV